MSEDGTPSPPTSVPRKRPTSRLFEQRGDSARQKTADDQPVIQVPSTPSPGRSDSTTKQKRPTSLYRNARPLGGGNMPGRVAPRSDFADSKSTKTGRLLSLESYAYNGRSNETNGGSTVFSRYAKLLSSDNSGSKSTSASQQTGPSPVAGLSVDQRKIVDQLSKLFKHVTEERLVALVKRYSAFNAVADILNSERRQSSSKRQIDKPVKKITEKFGTSARSTHNFIDDEEDDDGTIIKRRPTPSSANFVENESQGSAAPSRGRLVKAKSLDEEEPVFSDDSDEEHYESEGEVEFDQRLLEFLNTASLEDIADIAACKEELAKLIVDSRPFESVDAAREVDVHDPNRKPSKRQRKPAGEKLVNDCSSTLRGYEAVDSLIRKCDELGNQVSNGIKQWGVNVLGTEKGDSQITLTEVVEEDDDDEVQLKKRGGYFTKQPKLLPEDVKLKSYQQVGINWLSLLYNSGLSCILADEMGLGKTCQVIAFLAHLQEIDRPGPHLVVVPSSTLENWLREFQRFCPSLKIEPYYGSQAEREELRDHLSNPETKFDVMVTTYNLACGSKSDFGFLKSMKFNVCVYDEGHLLKNNQSERYSKLMRLRANFRLLLTGTPLQNNLKELVSLLSFILPSMFQERKDELAGIFKHKAKATDDHASSRNPLLSEQRITKAKTMMTPFVLRRRKEHVLRHLPPKSHRVEFCGMTDLQKEIYNQELETSRKNIEIREAGGRAPMTNVLMQLRKAAIHPLLFRKHYNDERLHEMTKQIMKEPVYRDANEQYIFEDMQVMSDFELHGLCDKFQGTIGKYRLPEDEWMNSGKVQKLATDLPKMKENGDRVLLFSQFTQVLDILEKVLSKMNIAFLRLDGQTPVELRQDLIDKFTNETDITVFLLSTKAGGFGINLASANTVIIHDLSFNPHDDKQAEDRAHRVGQTQEVSVIRLIAKETIEENILQLANTKLELDASVSDEKEAEKQEQNNAKMVARMVFGTNALPTENNSSASTPLNSSMPTTPAPSNTVTDEGGRTESEPL